MAQKQNIVRQPVGQQHKVKRPIAAHVSSDAVAHEPLPNDQFRAPFFAFVLLR